MQIDLLCEYASNIAGQPAAGVVKELHGKKRVNEFLISKKLKLTINQTRNILYRLADEGLVSFIRKKDKKKGGWYTYFWSLEIGKGLQKMHELLMEKIEELRDRLESRISQRFYYCSECNMEYNEENALLGDYHCSECGELLGLKDAAEELEKIRGELQDLEKQLDEVSKEVEFWDKREEKSRFRKARVEDKKKEDERKKKRAKNKKDKLRELKKAGKGKIVKEVKKNPKKKKMVKPKQKIKSNKSKPKTMTFKKGHQGYKSLNVLKRNILLTSRSPKEKGKSFIKKIFGSKKKKK